MTGTLAEHHGYLSDGRRIEQFGIAIARSVRPGDVVVDVGCGFGVLGLMCLEAGAARVYGIDSTDAIDIARETVARAGLEKRYVSLRGRSFEIELPERADVLICDHVGYLGVDYGIVEMLTDARRRFLKPAGRIIPDGVTLSLAAVRSQDLRGKLDIWNEPGVLPAYRWLRDYAVNTKHAVDIPADALVSQPEVAGAVDFADDIPATIRLNASLLVAEPGPVDGIAGWFDCTLAGEIGMTNSPLAAQRIDRHQAFLGFEAQLEVEAGDTINVDVTIRHEDSILAWSASVRRTGQRARQSTWASMPVSQSSRLQPSNAARHLSTRGRAAQRVLEKIDGTRTGAEIEAAVLAEAPDLFPNRDQLRRFVRDELARSSH